MKKVWAVLLLIAMALTFDYSQAAVRDFYLSDTLVVESNPQSIERQNTWRTHGTPFDSFAGVTAFSNRSGGEYQCTQLVHRFFNHTYGIPTRIGIGMGNANVMLRNIVSRFGSGIYRYRGQSVRMRLHANGSASEPPAVGSAINTSIGSMGHTAIVRYVEQIDNSSAYLYLFEQHGFPAWSPGDRKPIRRLKAVKSGNRWRVENGPRIGTPIHWINFQVL